MFAKIVIVITIADHNKCLLICRYRNYPPEQLVDIVARILAMVPPWTRVYRVQRDIPMPLVTSGVEKGNLRELALARMDDLGLKCRDVRTREAGIQVNEQVYLNVFSHTSYSPQFKTWYFTIVKDLKSFPILRLQDIHHKIKPEEVELVRRDYMANEGWETFLSYEDVRQVSSSPRPISSAFYARKNLRLMLCFDCGACYEGIN